MFKEWCALWKVYRYQIKPIVKWEFNAKNFFWQNQYFFYFLCYGDFSPITQLRKHSRGSAQFSIFQICKVCTVYLTKNLKGNTSTLIVVTFKNLAISSNSSLSGDLLMAYFTARYSSCDALKCLLELLKGDAIKRRKYGMAWSVSVDSPLSSLFRQVNAWKYCIMQCINCVHDCV